MRKVIHIFATCFILISNIDKSYSNTFGFQMPDGIRRIVVPFEQYDNLIIIPIKVNGLELNFILDTGVRYPILTEPAIAKVLGMEYSKEILVYGRGIKDSVTARVAKQVKLELVEGMVAQMRQSFLVLDKDYLELKKNLGIDVYGVIGYDVFRRFIVKIDYEDNFITLIEPDAFRPRKKYTRIPITIKKSKPYIDVTIQDGHSIEVTQAMMIDTGASHSILLDPHQDNIILPDVKISSVIGRGLAGDIYGHLGRLDAIQVEEFEINETIATFPESKEHSRMIKRGSKHGTIGGEFLSRFDVVIDYYHGYIYLKKNRYYDHQFEHDMSGLNITANGTTFDSFEVNSVRKNSPAYLAGIQKGDIIRTINGYDYEMIKLSGAHALLRYRPGKKIVVRIQRGDEKIKKTFRLERFI